MRLRITRYNWIGPKGWKTFVRRDKVYDLRRITDEQVDALLAEDAGYWGTKFKAKRKPAKKKKVDSDFGDE